MVDVKDMMDENMKEFMREIATSVRNDIKETLKDAMITKKEEIKLDLTPNLQQESITEDTPQQTLRDEQLNNLIEEMEIEKNLTRGKHQHHMKKLKTKKDQEAIETNSESASKTRASTMKSRQKRPYRKGKNR